MFPYKIWIYILNPTLCSENTSRENTMINIIDSFLLWRESFRNIICWASQHSDAGFWILIVFYTNFHLLHNWETSLEVSFLKNAPKFKQYESCFPFGLSYGFRIRSFQWIRYKDLFAIVLVISNNTRTFTNSNGSLHSNWVLTISKLIVSTYTLQRFIWCLLFNPYVILDIKGVE